MLTNEEILTEYVKCVKDPIYTIETYLKTKDLTQGGFVPFKLFPRQKQVVRAYENHRFNLVTKPRQAGISTRRSAIAAVTRMLPSPPMQSPLCIMHAAACPV